MPSGLCFRVHTYIANGIDQELVDPDGGANIDRKRKAIAESGGSNTPEDLLVQYPEVGWSNSLRTVPEVKFPAIYQHFMEKSLVGSARSSLATAPSDSDLSESEVFSSFKGIDKGYNFFRSGHVQKLELADGTGCSFVRCTVLPSMKKCDPYRTKVCLHPDGMVKAAICTCTAGLAGCCNHVAGLLYALEEFVRFGLKADDPTSPTSRLCQWNRPRSKKVVPQRVADIRLAKASFSGKRTSLKRAEYNVIPPNKRILDPAEVEKFKGDLQAAHASAISTDKSGNVARYGSSTWLTALQAADAADSSTDSDTTSASSDSGSDMEPQPVASADSQHAFASCDHFYQAKVSTSRAICLLYVYVYGNDFLWCTTL